MREKNENQREVLQAILSALDQLSAEGRERILRAVWTWYELGSGEERRSVGAEPRAVVRMAPNDRKFNFSDRETLSPKEFLHEKQPRTDVERVACLAYYLTRYRDTQRFKTIDISKLNTEAAQLKFSNATVAVANAAASGLLAPAGKGTKQISAIGEQFVGALPDRDRAKAVVATVRRRRSRSKGSGRKKARQVSK